MLAPFPHNDLMHVVGMYRGVCIRDKSRRKSEEKKGMFSLSILNDLNDRDFFYKKVNKDKTYAWLDLVLDAVL